MTLRKDTNSGNDPKLDTSCSVPDDARRPDGQQSSFKVGVVMDDKIITIEMPWVTIRETAEAGLAEYILNQMRELRPASN